MRKEIDATPFTDEFNGCAGDRIGTKVCQAHFDGWVPAGKGMTGALSRLVIPASVGKGV